jgi:hypothetical protein
MRTDACTIIMMVATLLAGAAAIAAPGDSDRDHGPVTIVGDSQFYTLLKSGQLHLTGPAQVRNEFRQFELKEKSDKKIVEEFVRQHPDLPGLARLVAATPTDPGVFRMSNGNYQWAFTNQQGATQIVQTMGQGAKLAALAGSIRAAADPVRKLALYTTLYTKYAAQYDRICQSDPLVPPPKGCATLTPPSALTDPGALLNASIDVIDSALGQLGSQGPSILHVVAPAAISVGVSCSAEIGASVNADQVDTGDQVGSAGAGCPAPSAGGILANFNWVDKSQLTCVKNQGRRGLCHIFAATSAIEEEIARDTGDHVNLSEQDFTEHETLIWNTAAFHDAGDSYNDLQDAAANGYRFAYEFQWDYNPSVFQPSSGYEFINTCENYPYPTLELGCSNSTAQAPLYCTQDYTNCGFLPVTVSGATSPYGSPGAQELFSISGFNNQGNPSYPYPDINAIQLALAVNAPVILLFNVTQKFPGAPGGYVPTDVFDLETSVGVHVVHVVGYVSNEELAANAGTSGAPPGSLGGYFIIKNSWGCNAGDAGYYYMPVGYLLVEAGEVIILP